MSLARSAPTLALLLGALAAVVGCGDDDPQDSRAASGADTAVVPLSEHAAVATLEELEARHGQNVLVPDPDRPFVPADAPDDTVLRRWFGDRATGMNPVLDSNAALRDSIVALCTLDLGLRHRLDPSRFAPGAADYCGRSEDGRTVTVRIRPGIRWQYPAVDRSDPRHAWLEDLYAGGAPELTAADVRFTRDAMLHPDVESKQRAAAEGFSLQVLDRYTFQLHWDHDYPYAVEDALVWVGVLPEFLFRRDEDGRLLEDDEFADAFNRHWLNNQYVGYGPYEFVSFAQGDEIVLRRKEDFAPLRPPIREVRWKVLSDAEQVVLRLKSGELDHIALQPEQRRKYIVETPEGPVFRDADFGVVEYDQLSYSYLGWNNRRPPFDDARVRRAMSHAFDRQRIFEKIFDGEGGLVESHVYAKHPHCNTSLAGVPFDLGAARRLLEEAGWKDADGDGLREKEIGGETRPFRFEMKSFGESHEFQAAMDVFAEDLRKVGVEMNNVPLPWPQLSSAVSAHDFDGCTGFWSLGWELDFYYVWHSSQAADGLNRIGFADAEADRLMEEYRTTLDAGARRQAAWRIQEIIHREQPCTFFFQRSRMLAWQPWLRNAEQVYTARPQLLSFFWYRKP